MLTKLENAQAAKQFLETDDNVDDIYVMRKQFRAQCAPGVGCGHACRSQCSVFSSVSLSMRAGRDDNR